MLEWTAGAGGTKQRPDIDWWSPFGEMKCGTQEVKWPRKREESDSSSCLWFTSSAWSTLSLQDAFSAVKTVSICSYSLLKELFTLKHSSF